MELRQLKYFEKAYEYQNFSEASRLLFISQSTLSQQIKQLEEELDILLFDRIGKRVVPTEAGKAFLPYARKAIQDAESGKTVEFEKVLLVDNNGTVTVGAPTVDGAKVVCEVVSPLVKGDKVLVFHKKRRKGYRKLNGHRQQFTELTIKQVIA